VLPVLFALPASGSVSLGRREPKGSGIARLEH